jgi:predicted nucleic-acid-binding Zn-ribbon protein
MKTDNIAEKLKKWLSDKKAYVAKCALCQTNDWEASTITHKTSGILDVSTAYSLIRIKCRNCHYIIFMDNSEIGL